LAFVPSRAVVSFGAMKRLIPLLLVCASVLCAEEVTLKQSAVLKADRTMVSLRPGTVVELVSRDGDQVTIKYQKLTGKIPASKLEEPKTAAATAQPEAAKPAEPAKSEPAPAPANPPQTTYGKAVQKAKDNAAAHDKNVAKPVDDVTKKE
jgi:hypothetical protein